MAIISLLIAMLLYIYLCNIFFHLILHYRLVFVWFHIKDQVIHIYKDLFNYFLHWTSLFLGCNIVWYQSITSLFYTVTNRFVCFSLYKLFLYSFFLLFYAFCLFEPILGHIIILHQLELLYEQKSKQMAFF